MVAGVVALVAATRPVPPTPVAGWLTAGYYRGVPVVVTRPPSESENQMSVPTCAVWYWSHGSVSVETFDDEESAARFAHDLSDYDEGSAAGVQYPDGSYVDRSEWAAYAAEGSRRIRAAIEAVSQTQAAPTPRRVISPPFEYRGKVAVSPSAPEWLGAQVASR